MTPTLTRHGRRPPAGQLATALTPRTMSTTLRVHGAIPNELASILRTSRGDRSLLAALQFPAGDIPFTGVLMYADTYTSDFRRFNIDGGRARDLPLPLMANMETPEWGHEGAVTAGRIEGLTLASGPCAFSGFLNDPTTSDEAFQIAYAVATGNLRGVSVDLGITDADWDPVRWDDEGYPCEWAMVATEWEVMGGTITPFPAFSGCYLALPDVPGAVVEAPTQVSPTVDTPPGEGESEPIAASGVRRHVRTIVASASGSGDLPLAAQDSPWDETAAAGRVLEFATDDAGNVDEQAYSDAFLWHDDTVEGIDGYRLGFADVSTDGATLLAVPAGIMAAADQVDAGIDGMPDAEAETIRGTIDGYCAAMRDAFGDDTIRAPWDDGSAAEGDTGDQTDTTDSNLAGRVIVASARTVQEGSVASTFPLQPLSAWFDNPGLTEPTEPRYLGTGRCYGHLALFDTCHIGFEDACVCAPHSALDYALFHTGYVTTAEGVDVRVGQLTIGTGHALDYLGASAAAAHYDNTGTAYADVHVGEDEHGIWFAGAMRRTMTDDELREAQASAISGDWRDVNGHLELVAALAVNVPGFPVYRALTASGASPVPALAPHLRVRNGVQVSLTASAGVAPLARLVSRRQSQVSMADFDVVLERLAVQDRELRSLRAKVDALDPMIREQAMARLQRG